MAKGETSRRLQQAIGPILAMGLMIYFIYHIIQGERGILSWMRLQQRITESQQLLDEVQIEQADLEHRVQLLRPDSLDPDMLEERARQALNFARADEIVIYDSEVPSTTPEKTSASLKDEGKKSPEPSRPKTVQEKTVQEKMGGEKNGKKTHQEPKVTGKKIEGKKTEEKK